MEKDEQSQFVEASAASVPEQQEGQLQLTNSAGQMSETTKEPSPVVNKKDEGASASKNPGGAMDNPVVQPADANELTVMSGLNTRLRDYLLKVKSINQLNYVLSHKLKESYVDLDHRLSDATEKSQKDLQQLREKYIKVYLEYVFYDIKYGRWEQKSKEVKSKIKMLEDELSTVLERRRELEPKRKRLEEEIAQINQRIREANEENRKAKANIERLEQEEELLSEKLETDKVVRAHLEVQVEFIKATTIFSRLLHDEIVGVFQRLGSDKASDARFYEMELDKAAREIRAEFSRRSEQSIQELANDYEVKLQQIKRSFERTEETLPSDQAHQADKQGDLRASLAATQEEAQQLKDKNVQLSNQLSMLENSLEQLVLENKEILQRRESLIQSTRSRIMELLIKCQSAKSAKCSLESEIDTYRHILGDEEVRLKKLDESLPPEMSLSSSAGELHEQEAEPDRRAGVMTRSRALRTHSTSTKVTSDTTTVTTKHEDVVLSSKKIETGHPKQTTTSAAVTKAPVTSAATTGPDSRHSESPATAPPKETRGDNEVRLKCRCGKVGNITMNGENESKYVQCADCGDLSHAACYNVGDIKDRKRKNFYCSTCYQAMKRHRS